MRVHLHTICWNERAMLAYFFRHYEGWVDRFFILDDGSTDGTPEYLATRPDVELGRLVHSDPDSWVASAKTVYDNDWKRSRGTADWVVVTNIDEHLRHRDMRSHLKSAMDCGATIVPALGYQIISSRAPQPDALLWRDCPRGAPWRSMSRVGIFRPDRIAETNFSPGRHLADLSGQVVYPCRDDVINLHYKYLWGLDRTYARYREQAPRFGERDRKEGWGYEYRWPKERMRANFAAFEKTLVDTTTFDHHRRHPGWRWWRKRNWQCVSLEADTG